jgi:hypothetical protein
MSGDLNTAFAAAAKTLKELADAQAAAWEEVMPGCSQVPPLVGAMSTHHPSHHRPSFLESTAA